MRKYLAERLSRTPRRAHRTDTPTYWYRCCRQSDVDQIVEPGQTFSVHWVAGEPGTPDLPTRYVTLSADLRGPYRDPFSNIADGEVLTISAPDIVADTWEAQGPVSSMLLPTDLPVGLFQVWTRLRIAVDSETQEQRMGTVSESMGVVRVERRPFFPIRSG